jgi:shikimate dehydrogenase
MRGTRERMFFIGVSTSGSSIMKLFPIWADVLGLDARVEGRDLPIGGAAHIYRSAVEEIATARDARGALVTTHKVDVFRHARDMFRELDDYALLCREVSSISKRAGGLIGHAKDPVTAGKALDRLLGDRPTPDDVVCLGAGGAGTAISVHLAGREPPPRRIVMVDRDATRIDDLRAVHSEMTLRSEVEYVVSMDASGNTEVLGGARAGALVINATGLGKDRPGSPLTPGAVFPRAALVWELNYRGDLDFVRQARVQEAERRLRIHDGWDYFLYGWSEVIAEVFALVVDESCFETLSAASEPLRPRAHLT